VPGLDFLKLNQRKRRELSPPTPGTADRRRFGAYGRQSLPAFVGALAPLAIERDSDPDARRSGNHRKNRHRQGATRGKAGQDRDGDSRSFGPVDDSHGRDVGLGMKWVTRDDTRINSM